MQKYQPEDYPSKNLSAAPKDYESRHPKKTIKISRAYVS
jgi:hypothetical protein